MSNYDTAETPRIWCHCLIRKDYCIVLTSYVTGKPELFLTTYNEYFNCYPEEMFLYPVDGVFRENAKAALDNGNYERAKLAWKMK